MSGIEVAGLVLGGIPLLISALEHYHDGVLSMQRWRKYARERQSLIRNLQVEKVKMQNVCEMLLLGLVPPSRLEAMIKDPGGSLWQEDAIKRKLRARLCDSTSTFQSIVTDMIDAIEEMRKKLGTSSDGDDREANKSSIVKEMKRAKFTIGRSSYTELMSVIQDGISNLETLTNQNVGLEPGRRGAARVKLLALLRGLSLGLYRALQRSLSCVSGHSINLRLCTRPYDIIHGETEAEILKELDFHLALFCPSKIPAGTKHWEDLRIEAVPAIEKPPVAEIKQPSEMHIAQTPLNGRRKKGVKFHSVSPHETLYTSTMTIVHAISMPLGVVAVDKAESPMLDLCERIRQSQKKTQINYYGFIADSDHQSSRFYNVYPIAAEGGGEENLSSPLSLRQAIQKEPHAQPLSYRDKIQLAVVIATSVLQLYDTPWLPLSLSADDILFIQKRRTHIYDNAFLCRAIPSRSLIITQSLRHKRNPTLLSLGFLLMEIHLGRLLLPQAEDGKEHGLDDYYYEAQRLLPRIRHQNSNYFSAVSRCLDGELHQIGCDEEFRHNMYSGVVALLEKDLAVL